MEQITQIENCHILHDEDVVGKLERKHFDLAYWQANAEFENVIAGRGGSIKIDLDGRPAILRQYLRGGLVARLSADRYLWLGRNRTRAWREWAILELALEAGLPVPTPLGVCVCRGGLSYRAAIITAYIKNTETLAERITHSELGLKSWHRLGLLLQKFQQHRFRHADLNANNLLVDKQGQFYIIDFDKARVMRNLDNWQWSPLLRLQRSLEKINRQQKLHYGPTDWQALIDGYQSTDS
jgi:3-deoxy-D-manno-octulosonic acid kinase